MRPFVPLAVLLFAAAIAGCAPAPERGGERAPAQAGSQILAPEAGADLWDSISEGVPLDQATQTEFFAPERAPTCPVIKVENAQGNRQAVAPGRAGYVTIVVFWSVDTSCGRVAARHVSDLVRRYRRWQVRGLAIVEKTQPAAAVSSFLTQHGVLLPVYYDDLSAVEEMSEEADAEHETAIPSFFIVDRQMRIRFYRAGFRYTVGAVGVRRPGTEMVIESAPPGESVEDYLRVILEEG